MEEALFPSIFKFTKLEENFGAITLLPHFEEDSLKANITKLEESFGAITLLSHFEEDSLKAVCPMNIFFLDLVREVQIVN